jgi:uncharacterized protein (TIGR03437 family)
MTLQALLLSNFLTVIGAFAQATVPPPQVDSIVDMASYSHEIAPGTLISIFGSNLAPESRTVSNLPLPTSVGGVSLEVRDAAQTQFAPLVFVSPEQINAQLPFQIVGQKADARVLNAGGASVLVPLSILPRAPRLFLAGSDGKGDLLLLFHADNRKVNADAPATAGEVLSLYLIGLGSVIPEIPAGAAAGDGQDAGPFNLVSEPVSVLMDGSSAEVLFAGLAPYTTGLYQIAFRVPPGLITDSPSLLVAVGQMQSQTGVSMAASLATSSGRQYYTAPNGTPGGTGSKADPWDLVTALSQPTVVKPGDTIWLRGGTYGKGTTEFNSKLAGTESKPVVVRQYPGERATIDGHVAINGSNAWFWGFEVTNSGTNRVSTVAGPFGGTRAYGIDVYGPNTRFINLVVHDTDQGIGFWAPAVNAEVYGCVIYHNGWQGPDRGHGHGIYTQNQDGTKHIGDNIIFNQFELGIQAYGSSNAAVKGYLVNNNVLFNNGSLSADGGRVDNILFGYGGALERIRIDSNYTYHTPAVDTGYSRIGWGFGGINKDVVVTNNYWVGGYDAIELWNWGTLTFSNNTSFSKGGSNMILTVAPEQHTADYVFGNNSYYGLGRFGFNSQSLNWEAWKSATGLDGGSKFVPGRPQGTWAFVLPNSYEPGRANIVIYNWDLKSAVDVDVSAVLKLGASYEIRDAEYFFGPPIATGTYSGGQIHINMTGLLLAAPVGNVPSIPKHTAPEFGAFILISH